VNRARRRDGRFFFETMRARRDGCERDDASTTRDEVSRARMVEFALEAPVLGIPIE